MSQAGSGPVNDCSDPVLTSWSAISLRMIPSWPGAHISWTLFCSASCMMRWSGVYQVLSLQLDCLVDYRYSYFYSFYLDSQLRKL
jgi:hypothetical protein